MMVTCQKISVDRICHLQELEFWMRSHEVEKEDICIVGSAVMAAHRLRTNGDLEIIIKPQVRKRLNLGYENSYHTDYLFGHIPIAESVDLFRNFCYPMGYTDVKVFKRHKYDTVDGWNMISLSMQLSYKYFLLEYLGRKKDRDDIELLEKYLCCHGERRSYKYRIIRIRFSYWFWNHYIRLKEIIKR